MSTYYLAFSLSFYHYVYHLTEKAECKLARNETGSFYV